MMSEVTEIPGLVADYDFDLPAECIAARPAVPRDAARLLEVGESLRDLGMRDLPALLRPGDVLVVNDTRVIPARLRGRRPADAGAGAGGGPGGARAEAGIEVTLHRQESTDTWRALARPTKRLRIGDNIDFAPGLCAEVLAKAGEGLAKEGNNAGAEGELRLRFTLGGKALTAAIARIGTMPLPPYIPRPKGSDARDRHDYQTMFARREGAVAAPTAGLHFTDRLLADIRARGVAVVTVTLHVGAGTFLPVRSTRVRDHRMHAEVGFIGAEAAQAINAARRKGGRVVAVGSTALRLLETAADEDGRVRPFSGETDIFITPGYRFRTVDLLITNFHLPRSTLFMLVSAFSGLARMRAAYAHAMARGYRFYSYGDGCLLHRAAAA